VEGAVRAERRRRIGSGVLRLATCGAAGVLLLATLGVMPARPGQVRVNAGSGLFFSPKIVNVNLGDHVVWVWAGGANHTVTSGDSDTVTPDGIFGFGFPALSNFRYSWKSTQTGNLGYFCEPHAPNMAGRVVVHAAASPVDVSDFRITEAQFNLPSGQDLIEIANLGKAAGNLGQYRIAAAVGTPTVLPGPSATPNDILVPAGGRVVIHLNVTAVNTSTDLYIPSFSPGVGLPDASGSLALYVPATSSVQSTASSNGELMIDFVQWGAPGQANETTAAVAGFWGAGTSINGVAAGHSIEYCANPTLDHGSNHWAEVAVPNFGSNGNCSTPVASETWGRLKIIYRR
jgi:plastocyanin